MVESLLNPETFIRELLLTCFVELTYTSSVDFTRMELFMWCQSHKTPGQGAATQAGRWGWRPDAPGQRTKNSHFPRKGSAFSCLGDFSEFHNPFLSLPALFSFFFSLKKRKKKKKSLEVSQAFTR